MANFNRISSIDIMRGLLLFLMLAFNYPGAENILPAWLQNVPGISGEVCWIFPGFLFLTGISIPVAFNARISRGERQADMIRHIFIRSVGLLIIGLLLINMPRIDSQITGINKYLWSIAAVTGIFLVWNDYPGKDDNFFTVTGLRLLGMALLTFLIFKFRSGQPENNGSLITGWWGFPGLIAWGYLTASLVYVFFRRSLILVVLITMAFLAMNILSDLQMMRLPHAAESLFGAVTGGHVPFIVMTGMLTGIIIKNSSLPGYGKVTGILSGIMILLSASGIIIFLTGILPGDGTTAISLISGGACLFLYILIYLITDIKNLTGWAAFFRFAGENSLTAYLAPIFIYYVIMATGLPVLFFKDTERPAMLIAGSVIWAFIMIQLSALLVRLNTRLKL